MSNYIIGSYKNEELLLEEDDIMTDLGINPEDLFLLAKEYIKDFDYYAAAKRLRMPYNVVWQASRLSLFELALASIVDGAEDLTKLITRNRVAIGLWQEAKNDTDGSPGSRIAALAKLSTMLGYDAAQQIDVNVDTSPKLEIRLARGSHDHLLDIDAIEAEINDIKLSEGEGEGEGEGEDADER